MCGRPRWTWNAIRSICRWYDVVAVAPANDPAKWAVVGRLSTTAQPAVHSNRAVAPSPLGGAFYAPDADALMISTRRGVSLFSTDDAFTMLRKQGFKPLKLAAGDIPGEGPLYDFLRKNKLRAVWTSASKGVSDASLALFRKAQINALFYNTFYYRHSEFFGNNKIADYLADLGRRAGKHDIKLFVVAQPFGWSAMNHSGIRDYDYRKLVLPSGEVGRYLKEPRLETWTRREFPCPRDAGYWARSIDAHLSSWRSFH